MKKRFYHIDFLRAAAIIGVIAIHVLSYSPVSRLNDFVGNYLHFVVVAFVFCSGYVMFSRYPERVQTLKQTLKWYKKRLIRLLLPFYIYLGLHYLLWILFPNYFSGLGLQKSSNFIVNSIFLTGGQNLNWLPLLFIELMFLFPIFALFHKRKKSLILYLSFTFAVTIFFTFFRFPYNYYRFEMWIGWSIVFLMPMTFVIYEKEKLRIKTYILFGGISAIIFTILFILWHFIPRSFYLIDHKYPPDLYNLSYGTAISMILILISKFKIFEKKIIKKAYLFLSKHSYNLFFVHYIVLDFSIKQNIVNFWFVLLGSILISVLIIDGTKILRTLNFRSRGERN